MAKMIDKIKNMDTDIPKWDVALAALVKEESTTLARGLQLEDFQRLAAQHAIRFDDIMATLFELVLHGKWRYEDPPGVKVIITRDEVEKLYVGGRLAQADVNQYCGVWLPVK